MAWSTVVAQPSLECAVEHVARAYDFSRHSYFVWIRETSTDRDHFRASQVPFRFAVESFSQALAGVLARISRVEERMDLAENIAEEHGHGSLSTSHKYTFLEYLKAIGATAEELARDCPIQVTAFNQSLRNLCLAQSHEVGAAALGIIEHLYVDVSAMIGGVIHERGWTAPGTQRHYAVHETLDRRHARELFDLAAPAWETTRTRAPTALALLLGAHYFWTLYDDLLPEE
jgi:pyrroloquinoline-quinone synthase